MILYEKFKEIQEPIRYESEKQMKKKPKIRIIKDNVKSSDSYTFLSKEISSTVTSDINKEDLELDENIDDQKLDQLYKNKKVLTNEDMANSSKGLKFSKPSQRNHSSIYE